MAADPNKKGTMTRQGWALVLAMQTGLVKQDEDGSADTTAFNRFWERVETEIFPQVCKEMENYLRKETGKKMKNIFRRS